MKVYRCLSKNELKNILDGQVENLGNSFSDHPELSNTHIYHQGKKYIHFFLTKKSCKYLLEIRDIADYEYICTFNIPLAKLVKYRGKGYYYIENPKYTHGYDNLPAIKTINEFAIDSAIFEPNWLIKYESSNDYINNTHKGKTNGTTREL